MPVELWFTCLMVLTAGSFLMFPVMMGFGGQRFGRYYFISLTVLAFVTIIGMFYVK